MVLNTRALPNEYFFSLAVSYCKPQCYTLGSMRTLVLHGLPGRFLPGLPPFEMMRPVCHWAGRFNRPSAPAGAGYRSLGGASPPGNSQPPPRLSSV
jgi:hypothetical protein